MDGPVDQTGPWQIKAFPTSARLAVIAAARVEGLTVSQWLEKRVNEWLADGSPVRVSAAPPPAAVRETFAMVADMGRAGVPVQKGVAVLLNRLVKQQLRGQVATPVAAKQLAAPKG